MARTCNTAVPAGRPVVIVGPPSALPVRALSDADPIEGHEQDRFRDNFGRLPCRVSVITDGVEVAHFWSFTPREDAAAYVATHPDMQVTFGLLADAKIRHADSGLPIEVRE